MYTLYFNSRYSLCAHLLQHVQIYSTKRILTIPLSHQNPNILANELLPLYILSIFFTSIQGVTFFFIGFHCPGCFANKVFTVFENSFQSALGSGSSSDGLLSTSNRLQYSLSSSCVKGRSSIMSNILWWYPISRNRCNGNA